MKIVLPSNGKTLSSSLANAFERCSYFITINTGIPNQVISHFNYVQTANRYLGIQIGNLIAELNPDVIIMNEIGPEVFNHLQSMNIQFYLGIHGSIKHNVNAFLEGRLVKTNFAYYQLIN